MSLFLAVTLPAQSNEKAKEKSPADMAVEAFLKLRNEPNVEPTPERQAQIIKAGLDFLKQYPRHGKANTVINSLATYGTATMKTPKQAPMRTAWLSKLQYEIISQPPGEGANPVAATALKALSAAAAGELVKEVPNGENLSGFGEKIEQLGRMPESKLFLAEQYRAFIQLLKRMKKEAAAEKIVTQLLNSDDKRLAAMAQEELNLINIAKQPLQLTFTALDGKAVDVSTFRGKPLFFLFWSTTSKASLKELDTMQDNIGDLPKNKFQLILVNCDKEENRAEVEKEVSKRRLKYPVWYTGEGINNELAAKLNITKLPATALFNAGGIFINVGAQYAGTARQLKAMLAAK